MTYNPLSEVIDAPLAIDATVIKHLRDYRHVPKLDYLPGIDVTEERGRLESIVNHLVDRLIDGIEENPTKLWVLTQFQSSLESVEGEDTEAREHVGTALESVMDILGIDSSDGLLACYLGGI